MIQYCLIKKCKNINYKFNNIEDHCIELVPYGVQVRYPYQLELNEDDVKNAISSAERIENFIQNILRQLIVTILIYFGK